MILDIKLADVDGIAFFRRLQAEGMAVPTFFISGHATLTEAAMAVKLGAFDFLEKPFTAEKIAVTAQLISGESGTGKELVANAIHAHSRRSEAPLVKVNSSAIPETLLESELFGHERGAFTGASGQKRGMFGTAHRGTLFLDEVGDLSLAAQAKILRALQSGEIQKVGSERSLKVDVRVIAATHKDLRTQVASGGFREDLLYRLNVVPIHVPALRERVPDIPLLAHHFARIACERNNLHEKLIDEGVLAALQAYAWPGNVRELQNVMERMMILSGDRITLDDLPDTVLASSEASSAPSALREFRDRAEREFVLGVLKKNHGNISRAAIELGIARTYLHRRLVALGISKRDWIG